MLTPMKTLSISEPSRRAVLAGGLSGLAAALVLPGRVVALTTGQARELVGRLVGEINAVINSGRTETAMYAEFERIFVRYADVRTIAVTCLGPPARSATQGQLAAYVAAYQGYIARKYGKRFREFIGGEILIQDAREVRTFHEVKCIANLRGEAPFDFTFLVSDRSGEHKFFDMLIEGISLLQTEKTEIGAMLDRNRGSLDALIADLRLAG